MLKEKLTIKNIISKDITIKKITSKINGMLLKSPQYKSIKVFVTFFITLIF